MIIKELLTPDYFKEWLESKQPNGIVGDRGTCVDCPIANFLKYKGYSNPYVGSNAYCVDANYSDTEKWEYHTDWMKSFVYKLESNKELPIQITKELALNMLGE